MIIIARHGNTVANSGNLLCGWSDTDLTLEGEAQVKRVGKHIRDNHLDIHKPVCLYTSTSGRSVLSGKILSELIRFDEIHNCDSLRETNWGLYELCDSQSDEVKQFLAARERNRLGIRPPGGESYADCFMRVFRYLKFRNLLYDTEHVTHLFSVHCNSSKVLRGIFMNLDPADWMYFDHPHGVYYVIQTDKETGVLTCTEQRV
jgi:broad specificity phosphatase PhoE